MPCPSHDPDIPFRGNLPPPGTRPRPAGRRGISLIDLSARLYARDITIAVLLDNHQVLTTDQIAAILFNSTRTCYNRLQLLRRYNFVARFRPITSGPRPVPWHWTAGTLSARFVALAYQERPPNPKYLSERQDATLASPTLAHTLGANGFFTDLLTHSRTRPDTRLTRWWSPTQTAAAFNRRIHPDGHGVWRAGGTAGVGFYLEHDNGTENHSRLVAKLDAYRRLRADGGPDHPVLFWLPTTRRETNLHQRLADVDPGSITVATAARDQADRLGPARRCGGCTTADPNGSRSRTCPATTANPVPAPSRRPADSLLSTWPSLSTLLHG